MKIAIIGRAKTLLDTAELLFQKGHEIVLVVTSKEAPEYKVTSKDYEDFAVRTSAHYICSPKINDYFDQIKTLDSLDLGISINYSGIISQKVIDLFKLGILNAHGGDLPKYRGNACQAWAIINRENQIGLCVHKMIGGELDSGKIIERKIYPINIETRVGEVYDWFEIVIPEMMINALQKLELDEDYFLEEQNKDSREALRCYPRKPVDGRIDWTKSNEEIIRLINASSEPFYGAFTYCDMNENLEIKIWRAKLLDEDEIYLAIPGQVSRIHHSGEVDVITGDGKLRISEIEQNNIRMKPANFIKSIRTRFI